jgi:hypothetical protein
MTLVFVVADDAVYLNLILSRAHMQMFQIAINKVFEWLFAKVLASHRGGPGSIPGWDPLNYFFIRNNANRFTVLLAGRAFSVFLVCVATRVVDQDPDQEILSQRRIGSKTGSSYFLRKSYN